MRSSPHPAHRAARERCSGHMQRYGPLVEGVVKTDEGGRSRGFGFVTYETPDVAKAVLGEHIHYIDGKEVRAFSGEATTTARVVRSN